MTGVAGLQLRPFEEGSDDAAWDALVAGSCNGTFLHTRRFLSYHRDRFRDRSLVGEDGRGRVRLVLPAAELPHHRGTVASHPGITYGGVVHDGSVRGDDMVEVLEQAAALYRNAGFQLFRYKAIPSIYHRVPAADDEYALFRMGARLYRCDLSATIDVDRPRQISKGRKYQLAVAHRNQVCVKSGWDDLQPFWRLLGDSLRSRHGVSPVHTVEEISRLADLFPDRVQMMSARVDEEVVAGAVLFHTSPVLHVQYAAAGDAGRRTSALDAVIEAAIGVAADGGYRYFDYGVSTEDEGRTLNSPLHHYKLSFGGGGVIYNHYEMELS